MMFCKDMSDVASYEQDWGSQSLALRTSPSGRWVGKEIQGSSQ